MIIETRHAEAIGSVIRVVAMMLHDRRADIGKGLCMNLVLPSGLCDRECIEGVEIGIEAASPAPVGELLRVDDNLLNNVALGNVMRIILLAVFEPPVIGIGEVLIIDDGEKGVVFIRPNARR